MAISNTRDDREYGKFVESTSVPNLPAVAVVNPDGSNISGGGGGVADSHTMGYNTAWRNIGAELRADGSYALNVNVEFVNSCSNSVLSLPGTTWTQVIFSATCTKLWLRLDNISNSFYYRWNTVVPVDLSIYFRVSADMIYPFDYPNRLTAGGNNLYVYNPSAVAQTLQIFQELRV
jgi:hypothetical protein